MIRWDMLWSISCCLQSFYIVNIFLLAFVFSALISLVLRVSDSNICDQSCLSLWFLFFLICILTIMYEYQFTVPMAYIIFRKLLPLLGQQFVVPDIYHVPWAIAFHEWACVLCAIAKSQYSYKLMLLKLQIRLFFCLLLNLEQIGSEFNFGWVLSILLYSM